MWVRYIKSHFKGIAVLLIFCGVFALCFSLFRLPLGAVLYASAICAFLGIVFLILDYRSFSRRHKQLLVLAHEITVTAERMPSPSMLLEEEYQSIIRALFEEKLRLSDEADRRYTDLADYYTIWAHQIKTPIASMRLNLQREDSRENRQLSEDLQRIEQYVEMVLCYLRLDAGSTDYVIREYDLDDIVRQAVRKFSSQFIWKKIKLEYESLSCRVLTDEKWLLFVVEQVLSNALKYTRSGSISITLEEPKTLCIRDTGIGIAPEDLPRIFEKSYTGYNGRSDKKASGIGLYLCRRICRNLSHEITAQSEVDSGTLIRISLNSTEVEIE